MFQILRISNAIFFICFIVITIGSSLCTDISSQNILFDHNVVDEFQAAQPSKEEKMKNFEHWMKNQTRPIKTKLDIQISKNSYFATATEDISKNTAVIEIPLELMMNADSAKQTFLGGIMQQYPKLLTGRTILCLHLLVEKHNSTSFWKPYIDILPTAEEMNTPMFWTTPEREELRGSWTLERTLADLYGITEE